MLSNYVEGTVKLSPSSAKIIQVRSGERTSLSEDFDGVELSRYVAGKIPYHYRSAKKIALDFESAHDAIEMVLSLFAQAPTAEKFQNSHCGEIISSIYLEEVLGYRRLYCKLSLTTSENTNVHKMDGFFVNISTAPFHYLLVEAKTSVLPTSKTKFNGHRHGILKQMLESIGKYSHGDQRFDFTRIRDNLDTSFDPDVAKQIRSDLIPPGPKHSAYCGIAVVNSSTIDANDDDFIISTACPNEFSYRAVLVKDLAALASAAYKEGAKIMDAILKSAAS
jgi:hypothetical protein